MQNSKLSPASNEPAPGRRRYAVAFVCCLVAFSLYMAAQSMSSGLGQFDSKLPGRKPLIAMFTRLRLKLGDRVFAEAVVGKKGWLHYTGDGNLDSYQNRETLPPGGIERIAANIAVLDGMLRERNITLLVVIPPDKDTIYPETVPEQIQKMGAQSELDQLVSYMKQHGPPVLVDVRPAVMAARKQHDVFYKTDTHWNAYGAFAGYTDVMKALSAAYPELQPRALDRFRPKHIDPALRDLAAVIGSRSLLEPVIDLIPKRDDGVQWVTYNDDRIPVEVSYTPQANLPRLLMYRDSFGIGLQPFLAPHFSQATFIHTQSTYPSLLSIHQVDAARPNIVIVEFVERDLPFFDRWLQRYMENSK